MTSKEREALSIVDTMKLALEAFKKIRGDRYSHWEVGQEIDAIEEALLQTEQEQNAAINTLTCLGYTYHGGERWKPPLGKPPTWLTQPEQRSVSEHLEPVAWAMLHDNGDFIDAINPEEHARIEGGYKHALYTTPPQHSAIARSSSATPLTWVGLTDEEIVGIRKELNDRGQEFDSANDFYKAIEAKLKAKNEHLEKNT